VEDEKHAYQIQLEECQQKNRKLQQKNEDLKNLIKKKDAMDQQRSQYSNG
jgi:hypothetical protein